MKLAASRFPFILNTMEASGLTYRMRALQHFIMQNKLLCIVVLV